MGLYINPPDMSKEEWLEQHGRMSTNPFRVRLQRNNNDDPEVLVLLVDNGLFSAAAICYSDDEYERFIEGMQGRPYTQWFVPYEKLKPYLYGRKVEGIEDQSDG